MNIELRGSNGISVVPLESHLLSERRIIVSGAVDKEIAGNFIRQIILLNMLNSQKRIQVLLDIEGGDIESGLLMYDAIRSSSAKVDTFCIGRACGIGAMILASGTGKRSLLKHSVVNLHLEAEHSVIGIGAFDSEKDTLENKLVEILGNLTKMNASQIKSVLKYDKDLSSDNCVTIGLADKVSGIDEMIREENEYER